MTEMASPPALAFQDFETAAQLRKIPYFRPTRAQRLIMRCPVCGGDGEEMTLEVMHKAGYVFVKCDNECSPLDIVDSLKLDGLLRSPHTTDDLGAKHGNQIRIAYLFGELNARRAIHVQGLGWFWWNGHRWVEDRGDKRATEYLLRTLRQALKDAASDPELRKAVSQCETAASMAGVLRIAAALPDFRVDPEDLNADPHLFNCANETVDLRDGAARPHNPDDLLTQIAEASWDEHAEGKAWNKFLNEVLPNEAVQEYLRRVVGMALIGRVEHHILPILTGVGANGKSTFIDAVLHALGTYAMTADPDLFTAGQTSSVGQVDLMGKRVAVVSETDKGAKLAEETVKRLTGGDRIKARKLYQDWVEFNPSHTVFMVTNHPPQVSGDDDAMWRRLRVIRFDVVVPPERRDGTLPDKLKLEAEAILTWAMQGLADYQSGGLDEPDEVRLATDDYRTKSDHQGQFLAECCVIVNNTLTKIEGKVLYEKWCHWAIAEGCEPLGRNTFHEAMGKRKGIKSNRSSGKNWYQGVRLKTDVELTAAEAE